MRRRFILQLLGLVLGGFFCPDAAFCQSGSRDGVQLDSTVRKALDARLDEYFAAIEREGTDVQKGECDFLIETCTDSLMRQHVALSAYEHYRDSKVMGSEAVAIHVFDRWFDSGKVKMRNGTELLAARIFAEFNRMSLVGNKAPELILYDIDGNPFELYYSPSGRYSVLYFYDTSCSTCKVQSVLLRNLFHQEDFPVDMYAVYVGDDRDAWKLYIDNELSFDGVRTKSIHLWDPEISSDFQKKYGVIQTPRMFLISPDGTVLGRGLDVPALSQMLHAVFDEVELDYGSDESIELYDSVFGDALPVMGEVVAVADHIRTNTLEKRDTVMYRQMTGDLMHYLALKQGEGYKEGLNALIRDHILSRPDVWHSEDDSLKIIGMAQMFDDLLSRSAPGKRVPDMKVPGKLISYQKVREGEFNFRKLSGKRNYIMFVTDGCRVCAAEKEAAERLAADNRKIKVLMVDVDDVLAADPALSSRLFDSFDLSTLPFILETDRKGRISRRYMSFVK